MPSRSQGGIEVAPTALRRFGVLLLPLMLIVASAAASWGGQKETAEVGGDVSVGEPTVMESIPADSAGAVAASEAEAPVDAPADVAPALWSEAEGRSGEVSMLPLIAKVSIGLGLVVGLAWGSVWLLRRTALGQGAVGAGSTVKVMERTWLGPKKAIFLVDIAGRTLALGVSDDRINVLSSWEAGQIDLSQPQATPSAFAGQLKSLLKRNDRVEEVAV